MGVGLGPSTGTPFGPAIGVPFGPSILSDGAVSMGTPPGGIVFLGSGWTTSFSLGAGPPTFCSFAAVGSGAQFEVHGGRDLLR